MRKIYSSIDVGSSFIKIVVLEELDKNLNILANISYPSKGIKEYVSEYVFPGWKFVKGKSLMHNLSCFPNLSESSISNLKISEFKVLIGIVKYW